MKTIPDPSSDDADDGRTHAAPPAPAAEAIAAVDHAITSRRSVRAFLPTPVPRALVEEILAVASRAPSGTNTQPWRVHVVAGAQKDELATAVLHAHDHEQDEHEEEYHYYPVR